MPRVSIITALYNHERYIGNAIESVLRQTYSDWEHIIWDDGSTDQGLEIARSYADKHPGRIKVYTHPGGANRGQENTRNAALEEASGELLCLLDSDDWYLPNKLELLVPSLENHKIGLSYGRAEFYDEATGRMRPSGISFEPSGHVFDALVEENFVCAGATVFRRQCVEQGMRFDPTFKTIGEYPLWIRIARDWEFAHVPRPVSVWRDHGANLGTRLALLGKAELVTLCERLERDPEYSEYLPAIRKALAKKRYDYASELYRELDLVGVRRQCLRVVGETRASTEIRAKAAALAGLSLLGQAPNRYLSRFKRQLWEARRSRLR